MKFRGFVMKSMYYVGIFVLSVLFLFTAPKPSFAEQYVFTSVHPAGWNWSRIFGINEKGQIAGYGPVTTEAELHAFVWSNGIVTDIHPQGWKDSWAYDINETGQIAGIGVDEINERVFMAEDYTTKPLTWATYVWTRSRGMNDKGQIVGFGVRASDKEQRGLLWDGNANLISDISPTGWKSVTVYDINNAGVAVGYGFNPQARDTHAFKWNNGVITDIHDSSWTKSFARGMNENGQIVGEIATDRTGVIFKAVTWAADGTATVIHSTDWKQTRARGINNAGVIVGEGESFADGELHALLWKDGAVIDLHPQGWLNSQCYGINDAGQIIAWGTMADGSIRAFMIEIVP